MMHNTVNRQYRVPLTKNFSWPAIFEAKYSVLVPDDLIVSRVFTDTVDKVDCKFFHNLKIRLLQRLSPVVTEHNRAHFYSNRRGLIDVL